MNLWMVEVAFFIVAHTDSFHHVTGANIVNGRKSNDFFTPDDFESKRKGGTYH